MSWLFNTDSKQDKVKETKEQEQEEQEEQDTEETYSMEVECKNCEASTELEIPFGTGVKDYLAEKKLKCEECGCEL